MIVVMQIHGWIASAARAVRLYRPGKDIWSLRPHYQTARENAYNYPASRSRSSRLLLCLLRSAIPQMQQIELVTKIVICHRLRGT